MKMRTQNVPFSVTLLAALTSMTVAEQTLSGKITGYGAASNDPPGATICCGLQGSEHSATYDDPGTAAADNNKFPTGTKIYVPGLQKYFVIQDFCEDCTHQAVHFDLWTGPTDFGDKGPLDACAGDITTDNAAVIVDPNPGYAVVSTPLMDGSGKCGDAPDWSRTTPSSGGGGGGGGQSPAKGGLGGASSKSQAPSTFSTATKSTGTPTPPAGSGGVGNCSWEGHCQGAKCTDYNDCADPYSCVNGHCTM